MKMISFNMQKGKRISTFLVLALTLLAGCSTIEFVQHEQNTNTKSINRWHHSTLNGMVEISKPLNIQSICGEMAWTTITTEFTFLNAIPVVLVPGTPLVSFYSAWTNKVKCYEINEARNAQQGNSKP